jgi:hypothetical protein
LKYLRVLELENFDYSEENIKKIILEKIKSKLKNPKVTSVFIDYELDNEEITNVINL